MKRKFELVRTLNAILERDAVKLCFSILIIASVLPESVLTIRVSYGLSLAFFAVFGIEFAIRAAAFLPQARDGKAGAAEVFLLALDLVATLSFLPVEMIYPPAKGLKILRLFRLMRMFLLLRYWGPVGREIWVILMKRRYQVLFAASVVVILSFVGGALLANIEEFESVKSAEAGVGADGGFDFNDDGAVDHRDRSFGTRLWWAFRQIQDPGNIVKEPRGGLVMVLSVALTIGGVFIFSFVIGIGTNVVEELVQSSRGRPIGISGHSAILNISNSSHLLLRELQNYYFKHMRKPKIAVLGTGENRPDYLLEGDLSRIRYRWGNASSVLDLRKVDCEKASRVIILGNAEDPGSDARVVSQILSVRQLNPDGRILAEIFEEGNLTAAAEAGGADTAPIPVGKFSALFLTNILLFPGIEKVYRELLTSVGQEIYTVVFGQGSAPQAPSSPAVLKWGDLFEYAYRVRKSILLGFLVSDSSSRPDATGFVPVMNPDAKSAVPGAVRGFIALTQRFENLRDLAADFAAGRIRGVQPAGSAVPAPRLLLCPECFGVRKVLVCNFRDGLCDFIEQLLLFLKKVEIFVMVSDEAQTGSVERAMAAHAERSAVDSPLRGTTFSRNDGALECVLHGSGGFDASIKVIVGDPAAERDLTMPRSGGFSLRDIDAVVLTPHVNGGGDPDASIALAMLKIWNLRREKPELFKPTIRVIAEMNDPDKADLLEKRAAEHELESRRCRAVSVISRERVRNDFLAQNIFVPVISEVYGRLLSEEGMEICRLLPDFAGVDRETRVRFPDLLRTIWERDRLVLIGVELIDRESGARDVHLNPGPESRGFEFRFGDMVSAVVIGDTAGYSTFGQSCRCCMDSNGGRC